MDSRYGLKGKFALKVKLEGLSFESSPYSPPGTWEKALHCPLTDSLGAALAQ